MKINRKASSKLKKDIQDSLATNGLKVSEIARLAKVDAGQTSRICRGQFTTLSYNVVEICKVLGVRVQYVALPIEQAAAYETLITQTALDVWDKTPEDAERIISLLRQLSAFRGERPQPLP